MNKNYKHKKIYKIITLIVVIALTAITLFSCGYKGKLIENNQKINKQEDYTRKVIKIFEDNYLYDIDHDKITIGLINGILSQDKYGRLEIASQLVIDDTTEEKLIGVQFKRTTNSKYFVSNYINNEIKPKVKLLKKNNIETTETDELKIGDELLYFDIEGEKKYVEGLSAEDYLSLLKPNQQDILNGKKPIPDKFNLAVKRLNGPYIGEYESNFDILYFEVEKQIINSSFIEESYFLNEDTFVLKLDSFASLNSNVEEFIKKAYYIAEGKIVDGVDYSKVKNIAIDLTNNGGGDLDILALITFVLLGDLNNSRFMQLQTKHGNEYRIVNQQVSNLKLRSEKYYNLKSQFPEIYKAINNKTSEDALIKKRKDIKMYILSNDLTASASEALIGILKNTDYNPNFKKQIGQKTYGKGVAQSVINFPYFNYQGRNTNLVITTAKYNILNKQKKYENINEIGYKPEIIIDKNPETERVFADKSKNAFNKILLETILASEENND